MHLHEGISLAEELFPILKFLGPSLSPALWGREGKRGSPKFYFRGNLVESLAVTAPTRWSVSDMIVKRNFVSALTSGFESGSECWILMRVCSLISCV